ncbi:MAG: hypothetical protein Q9M37_09350 [Desulfonauticus sp.]|nr:hypothetical protein [Desulfonauticus sp.]
MIYYAHTGGYTELGGIKEFLLKIRFLNYKRLVPAIHKLPKKTKIKNVDTGLTGKLLFERIKERAKYNKDIKILIIVDDGDCKIKNNIINDSIERLKQELSNIKLIFLFAEPEIEKWFCLDKSCIPNKPCKSKGIHSLLTTLIENIDYQYDENKKSCKEKFSEKFKATLEQCGIYYSKSSNGSEYLKKIDQDVIQRKDEFSRTAILEIKSIDL